MTPTCHRCQSAAPHDGCRTCGARLCADCALDQGHCEVERDSPEVLYYQCPAANCGLWGCELQLTAEHVPRAAHCTPARIACRY